MPSSPAAGAEAAGSLLDAVDAATTRLRMGLEGSWDVQGADGTAVVSTLTTDLHYDSGDAENGSRHWRVGGRFSFSPGLDLRIEDSRRERQREAPDHGIHLNLNNAW